MIRLMTYIDIEDVQKIAFETWRETYKNIIPQDLQTLFLNRNYSDMMLMKRMEKTIMLIIEREGVPIGFANFTITDVDGDSELTAMYILPNYQKNGYGKKLLQEVLTKLSDANKLFVYVDEQNKIGRNFYQQQGFKFVETFDEHFENFPVRTSQYVYALSTD